MASYDRARGAWIPSRNGRVVQIVSVTGGLADLDITGDGVADDATPLGVDDAERQRLALLHSPGQSLWRISVSHFSPWGDRESVGEGKRVDLGGRRIIKKKKKRRCWFVLIL